MIIRLWGRGPTLGGHGGADGRVAREWGTRTRFRRLWAQRRVQTRLLEVVEFRVGRVKHGDHGAGVRMPVRAAVRPHGAKKTLIELEIRPTGKKVGPANF